MRHAWLSLIMCFGACATAVPARSSPASPTQPSSAATARGAMERLTYISVVYGGRRLIFERRFDLAANTPLMREPVFHDEHRGGREPRALSVLTPEGICETHVAASFRVVQNCGSSRRGEWSGVELAGCTFPESGPLVVFHGAEALRVQSLATLAPMTGEDARTFRRRALAQGLVPDPPGLRMGESAEMQREMEAMSHQAAVASGQTSPAPPPQPQRPPRAEVQLGAVRSAFGVWMIDAVNAEGHVVMATAGSPSASMRVHQGTRWHTIVAGPSDDVYAFLIGSRAYSWPVVVPVRRGSWPRSHRVPSPPFGLIGPVMCAD